MMTQTQIHKKPTTPVLLSTCLKVPESLCISVLNANVIGDCNGCEYYRSFKCRECGKLITPDISYAFWNRFCPFCGKVENI